MAYTVTDFLADVRREGMLPATSADGTATADILAQAQYELESRLLVASSPHLSFQHLFYAGNIFTGTGINAEDFILIHI